MHHLPFHQAKEIQKECGTILRFSKLHKPNLSKEEFHSIHKLNNNHNIIILEVGEGNATIVMNISNCE
jgi:hypothetical protein